MGGGGSFYDRDVTSGGTKTRAGFSDFAAQVTGRDSLDRSVLPLNRRFTTDSESPLVCPLDGTGSMGTLPKILCDKWPMIAGQIAMQKYLTDPEISLSIVGDVESDRAPIQVCDFAKIRDLDPLLKKLWIEGLGGGQHFESYEFMAYFYARLCDMPKAKTPIMIFTGDESFRENLTGRALTRHFGGQHSDVSASDIFKELREKFNNNVFLIHRFYESYGLDAEIVTQWQRVLGEENVVQLKKDTAVGDIMLGIIAIAGGSRTLDLYIEDIKKRPLKMGKTAYKPQSRERLNEVRESLEFLASVRKPSKRTRKPLATRGPADTAKKPVSPPVETPKIGKPKPGRIF